MIRNTEKLLVTLLAAAIICSTCRLASAGLIEHKLTASDAVRYEHFGCSVGISGNTAIVGKHADNLAGHWTGSAYIFQRQGTHWIEQAKLIASDAAADDNFGLRVGISGDTAIVGAYGNDDAGHHSGSAYIFQRSGTSWTEQAKLTASDAAADYQFGLSVAVSGDTAIIGGYRHAPAGDDTGSAYIFQRDGTSWTEQAKLIASDAALTDRFGGQVSISGDTAIVGASGNDADGYNSGSAYIFQGEGSSWTEQAKLTASDAAEWDMFGVSVGISGETAIVGTYNPESVYIFTRDGSSWAQQAKLTAADGVGNDKFGYSVGISGDTAIVGAHDDDDDGSSSGSAYIFSRNGSSWTEQPKLTASDAAADDEFGFSVAISGDTAIAGADMRDDHGSRSGAAYIYHPVPEPSGLVMLLGLGGACLLWYGRRRRNRVARP